MSSLLKDPMILREILLDHYEYPHNHKLTDNPAFREAHMASDSCIDDIRVQAKITDGIIEDVRFDGRACTISTASTSMMTDLVKGKSIADARVIMDNYFAMIDGKEYDEDLLEEAVALQGVSKQANRIRCATIGWRGLKQLIEESEAENDGK
ncbi:MAG: SUF system NifU family Fe-S cluster assembly protein [Erysipelotrichaceae bacterium]|jgi:nitrogen fixation NifU-like protein|nr:SUF system NifU family Fe-S cluster assembly protein [Erysipelotrichaceae bacterium]